MDSNDSSNELARRGFVTLNQLLTIPFVRALNLALAAAEESCAETRARRNLRDADGSAHHLPVFRGPFLELLEDTHLDRVIRAYFGGPFILNSYGASVNRPGVRSYLHNLHRDVRSFTQDVRLMLNVLVMLDDFTIENGATYFLSGSHLSPDRPAVEHWEGIAERATGRAGDVVFFDSRLWHAAAPNLTQQVRRGLTLTFTPPFMKPQFDYPRALGYDDGEQFNDRLREVLGYDSRVPASLDEWYRPPEQRFYRAGQG